MIERVLLFLAFHHIVWMICFCWYAWWVDQGEGGGEKVYVGIALAGLCLGTESLPFLLPGQPGALLAENRQLQYLYGIILLGAVAGVLLSGIIRVGAKLKGERVLGHCVSEADPGVPAVVLAQFKSARVRLFTLQALLGAGRASAVPLVLSESVTRPLLFGMNPARIYLPMALAERAGDLEALLEPVVRLSETMRYRTYVLLWWLAQVNPLLMVLVTALGRALGLECSREALVVDPAAARRGGPSRIPANTGNRKARGNDACLFGSSKTLSMDKRLAIILLPLFLAWATMISIAFTVAAQWTGGLQIFDLLRLIMKQEIIGFSVHGFDPTVEFKAIPGEGGILPDGLLVDTTRADSQIGCATVRIPLGLFDHEKLIPFGAKAVRVRLAWRVLARTPAAKELPAVKLASSEAGVIDADGQQKLWTFYTRNVFLGEGGSMAGVLDLPMLVHAEQRVLEQSKDVIYGPLVFVPEGWKLEFRHYSVESIEPDEVPPIPEGEPERFVAWYHRNGFKPATIDLNWRTSDGGRD